MKQPKTKTNKKYLIQILKNQKAIMIWIGSGDPYKGFFKYRIEETEELL